MSEGAGKGFDGPPPGGRRGALDALDASLAPPKGGRKAALDDLEKGLKLGDIPTESKKGSERWTLGKPEILKRLPGLPEPLKMLVKSQEFQQTALTMTGLAIIKMAAVSLTGQNFDTMETAAYGLLTGAARSILYEKFHSSGETKKKVVGKIILSSLLSAAAAGGAAYAKENGGIPPGTMVEDALLQTLARLGIGAGVGIMTGAVNEGISKIKGKETHLKRSLLTGAILGGAFATAGDGVRALSGLFRGEQGSRALVDTLGGVVGAISGATAAGIYDKVTKKRWNWKGAMVGAISGTVAGVAEAEGLRAIGFAPDFDQGVKEVTDVSRAAIPTPTRESIKPDENGIINLPPIGGSPSPRPDSSPALAGSSVKVEATITPSATSTETILPTKTPTATLTATPVPATATETEVPLAATGTATEVLLTATPTKTPFVPTSTATVEIPTVVPTATEVPATPVPILPTNTPVPLTNTPFEPTSSPDVVPPVIPEPVPTRHPWLGFDNSENPAVASTADNGDGALYKGMVSQAETAQYNPNIKYPPEIEERFTRWAQEVQDSGKGPEFVSLLKASPDATPFTLNEPLYADGGEHLDIAPLKSPDMLSLNGQLQGLYGDHLFKSLNTIDVNQYIQDHQLDPNDAELRSTLEEIKKNGRFDPFDGKHLKIRSLIMRDMGINEEKYNDRVVALYAYTKQATEAAGIRSFDANNSDYFDRTKGIILPANLDKWWTDLEKIN